MNNWPEIIRQRDLVNLVKEAAPLMEPLMGVKGAPGAMEAMEGFFSWAERLVPLVEKFSQSIMNMRQFEARTDPQDVTDGLGEVWGPEPDVARRPAPTTRAIQREPDAPEPDAPEPDAPESDAPAPLDPQRVFASLLGSLAQLPAEMTIGDALKMARANKELILPEIVKQLGELGQVPN